MITASHAHWQHGLAKRHGGLLGTIFRKAVYEHDVKGRANVSVAIACCCQAKNAVMTRNGLTAEQAVFGRSLRFTEMNTTDDCDDDILVGVLGAQGPAWRAQQIRSAAKLHLLRGDASEKVRRAMLRKAPLALGDLCPGSRIYFWVPIVGRGRRREDPKRWRGPATVIAKEGDHRFYIAYRGTIMLVAREQIRLATRIEQAADSIVEDMAQLEQRDDKSYQDIADPEAQPVIERRGYRTSPDALALDGASPTFPDGRTQRAEDRDESINPEILKAFRSQSKCSACGRFGHEAGDPRCPRAGADTGVSEPLALTVPVDPSQIDIGSALSRAAAASSSSSAAPPAPEDQDIQRAIEDASASLSGPGVEASKVSLREMWENPATRRRLMMDDVPLSIKRRKFEDDPTGAGSLVMLARGVVPHPEHGQWFDRHALDGLSACLAEL